MLLSMHSQVAIGYRQLRWGWHAQLCGGSTNRAAQLKSYSIESPSEPVAWTWAVQAWYEALQTAPHVSAGGSPVAAVGEETWQPISGDVANGADGGSMAPSHSGAQNPTSARAWAQPQGGVVLRLVMLGVLTPLADLASDLLVLRRLLDSQETAPTAVSAAALAVAAIVNGLAACGTLPLGGASSAHLCLHRRGARVHSRSATSASDDDGAETGSEDGELDARAEHSGDGARADAAHAGGPRDIGDGAADLPAPVAFALGALGLAVPLQSLCDAVDDRESASALRLRQVSALTLSAPQLFVQVALLWRPRDATTTATDVTAFASSPLLLNSACLSMVAAVLGIAAPWTSALFDLHHRVPSRLIRHRPAVLQTACLGFVAADLSLRCVTAAVVTSAIGAHGWALLLLAALVLYALSSRAVGARQLAPAGRACMLLTYACFQLCGPHAFAIISSGFLVTDALVSTVLCVLATALCLPPVGDGVATALPLRMTLSDAASAAEAMLVDQLGSIGVSLGLGGTASLGPGVSAPGLGAPALPSSASIGGGNQLRVSAMLHEAVARQHAAVVILACAAACKLSLFYFAIWPSRVGGAPLGRRIDGDVEEGELRGLSDVELAAQGATNVGVPPSPKRHGMVVTPAADHAVVRQQQLEWSAALLHASATGSVFLGELLIGMRASVHHRNRLGRTPLHLAACNGHESVVTMLLACGAALDETDVHGRRPLLVACLHGQAAMARMLLARHASIESTGNDGASALLLAATSGHVATIELLAENGAAMAQTDDDGGDALQCACANGHHATARALLMRGANVAHTDAAGRTALIWASACGYPRLATMLLEHGSQLDAATRTGHTALHKACANGHEAAARTLLWHGASLEHASRSGATALLHACQSGQTSVARMLLRHQANIEHTTRLGWTALLLASEQGHTSTVRLLLAHRAQMECADGDGDTALLHAASNEHEDTVKALLQHGARVNHANFESQTPLLIACAKGMQTIASRLLWGGADIAYTDSDGRNALLWACTSGDEGVVAILLERGAALDHVDFDGDTALTIAERRGYVAIVKLLRKQAREWWRDLYMELMMIKEYPPWHDHDDADSEKEQLAAREHTSLTA